MGKIEPISMEQATRKYVEDICSVLQITMPEISYDTSDFMSDTMWGEYVPDKNTIRIKSVDYLNPDYLFAIAHELRHVWQMRYNKDIFNGYKDTSQLSNDEYNLQEAELDANAFGAVIIRRYFNLKPLFDGMPDNIKDKIFERAEKIDKLL